MTFQTNGTGDAPAAIQQLVGTSVAIPGGDGLSNTGSGFGGWNVVSGPETGRHYAPGQIIPMPAGDLVLEPAWGHVEVELELGNVETLRATRWRTMLKLVILITVGFYTSTR